MRTRISRVPALAFAAAIGVSFLADRIFTLMAADDAPTKVADQAQPAKKQRLISLVLLLQEPRKLDHHVIAHAASSATGTDFPEENVENKPPYHLVRLRGGNFLVNAVEEPYFEKPAEVAKDIKDHHISDAVRDHRGWISIDWFGKEEPEDLRAAYGQIGRMIVGLGGREAAVLYSPELDDFAPLDAEAKEVLRSADPLRLFAAAADEPAPGARPHAGATPRPAADDGEGEGVVVADDDPRLKAARAEARRRWPEFIHAFNEKKAGQYFGVKGAFEEGDRAEYMWLTVSEVDEEQIHGTLESKPASLKGWKRGQDIHIKVANLDDWLYITPEKEAVGGFSEKVLAEVAKQEPRGEELERPVRQEPAP